MKKLMKKIRYGMIVPFATFSGTVMAADLDASALTAGIDSSKPIIIAVGTAIFGLVGLLVAIRYAKSAAR